MLKQITRILSSALHLSQRRAPGVRVGSTFFRDDAILFRMASGFAGDVNRTHPASVEPTLNSAAAPVLGYGFAVVLETGTNSVRQMAAGDVGVTAIYGISVRPFPTQQQSASNYGTAPFGSVVPQSGAIDVLKIGYIMCPLGGGGTAVKGGAVFIWVAASTGNHVQGQVEAAANAGNTAAITNAVFNGPAGADGIVEVIVRD